MRISSFKPQHRQAPPRAATPPRPVWEPLSPILRPLEAPPANPSISALTPPSNGFTSAAPPPQEQQKQSLPHVRAHAHQNSPTLTREQSLRSAPQPPRAAAYSPGLGSPIEALADVAMSSLHTSPHYIESARRSDLVPASPTTIPHPPGHRAPKHAYVIDGSRAYNERPMKRVRSEYFSPPHAQQFPSSITGHTQAWSYNVEQMADNGRRMYQDAALPVQYPDESSRKRLSDAELLINFAAHAFNATPQRPATAKRWSFSHQEPQSPLPHQKRAGPSNAHLETPLPSVQRVSGIPTSDYKLSPEMFPAAPEHMPNAVSAQTQTPPEDNAQIEAPPEAHTGDTKPKRQQGWPKGKPRGSRNGAASTKKRKSPPDSKAGSSYTVPEPPEQLHSPQSLPTEQHDVATAYASTILTRPLPSRENTSQSRRYSFSDTIPGMADNDGSILSVRARSVPLGTPMIIPPSANALPNSSSTEPVTICAGCNSSDSETTIGDGEQWIRCDGCKEWYHFVCAGFQNEREVRDVDKFYCAPCQPKFGETTKVRKSARAHTAVDYAGLNEGILKTSDDNPEHHYIAAFKNGDIEFAPETFARVPPELVSADFLEKTNGFKEPILVPAVLNPRPRYPGRDYPNDEAEHVKPDRSPEEHYRYELVPDDGQDKLDMVIPEGLTVRRVSELYGPQERVPVIDVKAQEGEDKRWTMAKWADYYEQQGEKPVRNVISLEVSRSRLGRLIRRPKAVRDMDLQDAVWRDDDKKAPPAVQFYCLMSVADCYTDFHIDFGGSSVYYHIVKGKKVFFFIPPTKQNLKKYEDWCLSPKQGHEFLGHQVKECYRVDLYPGDTMLIPSGWIHAVWTPEDSLVIGGNFLTRIHYGMQIKVLEIEKNTKVALKFRYPFFQKLMWLSLIRYLEEDPLPPSVEQILLGSDQFHRDIPIYCEPDRFGHNSHLGPENYNKRYYPKAELEGLPELANYIWRTVLISLGKVEGISDTVRKAVTSSIPKGFGDPLNLARQFAMWIAWKRGNEKIPQWAHPDATLPEAAENGGEKKMSAAQVKRMEREAWGEALRATAERQSTRIRATETPHTNGVENQSPAVPTPPPPMLTGFLQKTDPTRPLTTPKTSQLGPKRIACDACRKRRIRCKHKDEIFDPAKPSGMAGGMSTIDLSGSLGLSVKRRYSDLDGSHGQQAKILDKNVMSGGPLLADTNGDPYALKSGRVKACADCRKSKRRCIHDEYGNVDPVKANEIPIPRGAAAKKRRISEEDPSSVLGKMKKEPSVESPLVYNPIRQIRNSLPGRIGTENTTELQGLAYSAQQALDHVPIEDAMPIDPALQSFIHEQNTSAMEASSQEPHRDAVMYSIEDSPNNPMDIVDHFTRSEIPKPSVESLSPGSGPNGYPVGFNSVEEAHISPRTNRTEDLLLPVTPSAPRSARLGSSGRKPSQMTNLPIRKSNTPKTPSSRRRDSRGSQKMEARIEPKARASSSAVTDNEEDMASLALAMQLQMEEHGLRRRSMI